MVRASCWLAWLQGDYLAARSLWAEDLAIRREIGDQPGAAFALNWLGVVARDQGDHQTALEALEESLAIYQALGNRQGVADVLARLGSVVHALGDLARARTLYEESLDLRRKLGDQNMVVWTYYSLSLLALDQGDIAAARSLYISSTPLLQATDDMHAMLHVLALCASLASAMGRADGALRLAGAIEALGESTTVRLPLPYRDKLDRWLEVARKLVDPETAASTWALGRRMTLDQAIALALYAAQEPLADGA